MGKVILAVLVVCVLSQVINGNKYRFLAFPKDKLILILKYNLTYVLKVESFKSEINNLLNADILIPNLTMTAALQI